MFNYRLLFKETFYYIISKALPGVLGLVSVILFLRIFGSDQYGKYSLLLSQCNLIVAIAFGWLNQSQLRYYSSDSLKNEYKDNQIKALFLCFIICIIILSVLFFFQASSLKIWSISIITIFGIGLFNYVKTIFQVKLIPVKIVLLTSIQSLFGLTIPFLLLFIGLDGNITLLLGVGLSFIIALLLITFFNTNIFTNHLNKANSDRNDYILFKKWIYYGVPLSIWFAAGMALPFLDRLFINKFLTTNELGIYSGLQELLTRIYSLLLFPLILTLHPRITKLWNDSKFFEAKKLIVQSIKIILCLGCVILFIAWVFNDLFFSIARQAIPQLNDKSQQLLLPLLATGFFWQLSFITHKMLELKEKTSIMVIAILPSVVINIIGNIIFLPKFGQIATANTALISALTYCLITFFYSICSMKRIKKVKLL